MLLGSLGGKRGTKREASCETDLVVEHRGVTEAVKWTSNNLIESNVLRGTVRNVTRGTSEKFEQRSARSLVARWRW